MSTGRPTKYNPEVQERADYYLDSGYIDEEHPFPSEVGLSVYLGLAHSTVKKWDNDGDKPLFSATLGKIKTKQHMITVHKGISGDFNAAITKLVLHNFGYSDKVENTNQGPNGGPQEHKWLVEFVNATPESKPET